MSIDESKVEYLEANNFDLDLYEFEEYHRYPKMIERQNKVYHMYAYEDKSLRAIALELGVSKNTVLSDYKEVVKRLMQKNKDDLDKRFNDELARLEALEANYKELAFNENNIEAGKLLLAISKHRARMFGFGVNQDRELDPNTVIIQYMNDWRTSPTPAELPSPSGSNAFQGVRTDVFED